MRPGQDNNIRGICLRPEVIQGDVREVLKTLDEESVQCVVTSPPYWGLRDYGVDDQLGLEATPEEFVENLVEVFKEVKRVLRKDGTVWLNLGDSYASGKSRYSSKPQTIAKGKSHDEPMDGKKPDLYYHPVLKDKDLIGIPWRVALALQADGWYIRSDIIWNKPNPMPESVRDRPTKSHEYIFLLTKSAKYYYDHEAIKEKGEYPAGTKAAKGSAKRYSTDLVNSRPPEYKVYDGTRNKRSVWRITTKPYKEAHFATFPEELPETCIKAGTSKAGCCADCGTPIKRIVETNNPSKQSADYDNNLGWSNTHQKTSNPQSSKSLHRNKGGVYSSAVTRGWKPTCDCNADKVPCVVLDIFAGSGTTLRVASKLGRKGIGIELNPEYIKILKKRCKIESESLEVFA